MTLLWLWLALALAWAVNLLLLVWLLRLRMEVWASRRVIAALEGAVQRSGPKAGQKRGVNGAYLFVLVCAMQVLWIVRELWG